MGWLSTEGLARACARKPWVVLAVWAAVIIGGAYSASTIGGVLTSEFAILNDPESARAESVIEELRGPEQARELVIVRSEDFAVDQPQFRERVEALVVELRALKDVANVVSFYEVGADDLVSEDQHAVLIPVALNANVTEAADHVGDLVHVVEAANEDATSRFVVYTAGPGSIDRTFNELSAEDAQRGESIGAPVALLILLLVCGTVVAAGIPLILAIVSIIVAVGISALLGQAFELNFLVLNVISMIGLAVGIDYALFIVQRVREERERGLDTQESIARAGATASRAVLFSGGTVIVGLMGMLLVPSNVYRSLSAGAVIVAIVAVAAALTLLPAVLSLLGHRINALRLPKLGSATPSPGGFWDRTAKFVMAHPIPAVVLSAGLLVALSIPYFSINRGLAGVTTLPEDNDSRRAFEVLRRDFDGGLIAPAEIAIRAQDVTSPEMQQALSQLQERIDADDAFGGATTESNDRDIVVVSALFSGDPQGDASKDALRRLRGAYIPEAFAATDAEVAVGGTTAQVQDMTETIETYTPIVFSFVLGVSFILLLVVFRSIVVPMKAIVMNLLSVGAAYGLIVLVFQEGVGNELFGFQQTETIETWLPLFLFSLLFGLSMDYHVFLLSRIREHFDETHDNAASVAYGLRTTAALITGAALIMVAVFSGFATGRITPLEQLGFGLAVAVIIDATIVRCVLVPASMALLGDWNWYLPSWLRWLPDLRVEGGRDEAAAAPAADRSYGPAGGGT